MFIMAAGFYAAPKSAAVGNLYIVFHHRVKTMNDMGHL